jgi:hypothetical protein
MLGPARPAVGYVFAEGRDTAAIESQLIGFSVPIRARPPTGPGFARDKVAPVQTAVFAVVLWATAAG